MASATAALRDSLEAAIGRALRSTFAFIATRRARHKTPRAPEPRPALSHPALFISEWK
jgi:hypothetical protein